ncbi:MarR family winged helix-turn-helix transcriptional regulator [Prescottella sp. R16]|uniref:MarR family winged helix-turn-helix transcriptional regulator n=1 Tax=Prescottella sp. R16 TaxID=3064529 RepID=UPI00272E94CB|nr:MarR family transcriptional regulator [Prescottella sp. R16]
MSSTDPEFRDLLVQLVSNAHRFTRLASAVARDDRPRSWMRALSLLEEQGPLRVSTFARLDSSSQPSATALLKRLGDEGLVSRHPDPEDNRAILVDISDAGRRWLTDSRHHIADDLTPYFAHLEPAQVAALTEGLGELRTIIRSVAADRTTHPRRDT